MCLTGQNGQPGQKGQNGHKGQIGQNGLWAGNHSQQLSTRCQNPPHLYFQVSTGWYISLLPVLWLTSWPLEHPCWLSIRQALTLAHLHALLIYTLVGRVCTPECALVGLGLAFPRVCTPKSSDNKHEQYKLYSLIQFIQSSVWISNSLLTGTKSTLVFD